MRYINLHLHYITLLQSLVISLLLSRLDYGNATLASLPGNQLDRLQSVINAAARLVCSARKYEHITPLLRDLHWSPVRERIEFKLAVLVFCCLHGTAPPYVANELCRVADIDARRRLRSASPSCMPHAIPVTTLPIYRGLGPT